MILVIGDSQVALHRARLVAAFSSPVIVDGVIGATVLDQVSALRRYMRREDTPSAVVTELGGNDVLQGLADGVERQALCDQFAMDVNTFLRACGTTPVYWTNLPHTGRPEAWFCFYVVLEQARAKYPNLRVLDYDLWLRDHPGSLLNDGLPETDDDDVHLSTAAAPARAVWLSEAVP